MLTKLMFPFSYLSTSNFCLLDTKLLTGLTFDEVEHKNLPVTIVYPLSKIVLAIYTLWIMD